MPTVGELDSCPDIVCEEKAIINDLLVKSVFVTENNIFHINSHFDKATPLADLLLDIAKENIDKDTKNAVNSSVL